MALPCKLAPNGPPDGQEFEMNRATESAVSKRWLEGATCMLSRKFCTWNVGLRSWTFGRWELTKWLKAEGNEVAARTFERDSSTPGDDKVRLAFEAENDASSRIDNQQTRA